jgi:plasmid stabilization system protein ParE
MSPISLKLRVLRTAARDITEQTDFYRLRENDALAERWRASVTEAIRSLRTFPDRGELIQFDFHQAEGLRRLPIAGFPNHLIFYRYDARDRTIIIAYVLHGARDLASVLKQSH